jgi:hypothetical protein
LNDECRKPNDEEMTNVENQMTNSDPTAANAVGARGFDADEPGDAMARQMMAIRSAVSGMPHSPHVDEPDRTPYTDRF